MTTLPINPVLPCAHQKPVQPAYFGAYLFKKFAVSLRLVLLMLTMGFLNQTIHAQSYDGLIKLNGVQQNCYYSEGAEAKAKRMGKQVDAVIAFYAEQLDFSPRVTLLILSPRDWSRFTDFPVYGMPHYTNTQTLIVASEDNDFWKSMTPAPGKLPKEYADQIMQTYTDNNGGLTMEPFFDLLAIHELGHAYNNQGGLVMQRRWLGELLPNILLHTYIAEKEPNLLNALTLFPKMVVATTNVSSLTYTSLQDLEKYYDVMGPKMPQNYGWYQCRWHMAAGNIYDQAKLDGIKKLWAALQHQKTALTDEELADFLIRNGSKGVADVQLNWDKR